MRKFAVYARSVKDNHADYLKILYTKCSRESIELIVFEDYYRFLKETQQLNIDLPVFRHFEDMNTQPEVLISLGGDGTMLETLEFVKHSGIPVLGVNTGRLGYLASVYKENLGGAIDLLIQKKYKLDQRDLLMVESKDALFGDMNYGANELTIFKKDTSSMITVDVWVNDEFLNSYWADGLIVSTPTGSTAYSLSCGGPIVLPDAPSFIITPIAPHNLNVRPIVLSNHHQIRLKVKGRSDYYLVTLDSRSACVDSSAEITLQKANFTFNLINLDGQHYFNTLRNKLMWGLDKRN